MKVKKTPGTKLQKRKEKTEDQITVREMIRKLEDIGGKLTAPGNEKDIGKKNEFEKKTSPTSTPIRVRKIKRGGGNSEKKTAKKKNEKNKNQSMGNIRKFLTEKVTCRQDFAANTIANFSRFTLDRSQPLGIDQPGGGLQLDEPSRTGACEEGNDWRRRQADEWMSQSESRR